MSAEIEKNQAAKARVVPNWLQSGDVFWYRHQLSPDESEFVVVDAVKKARTGNFDQSSLAQHLEKYTKQPIDAAKLVEEKNLDEWNGPLNNDNLKGAFIRTESASPFAGKEVSVRFINTCKAPTIVQWIDHAGEPVHRDTLEPGKSGSFNSWAGHIWRLTNSGNQQIRAVYRSPKAVENDVVVLDDDMKWEAGTDNEQYPTIPLNIQFPHVFVRKFNVWISSAEGDEQQITTDGVEDDQYDEYHIYLSPDKQFVIVWQFTPEQEHKVHLLQSSPEDQLQPKLKTLQYLKAGDRVRMDRPRLFSVQNRCEIATDGTLFSNPFDLIDLGWNSQSSEYRFIFNERGHQNLRVIGINRSGNVRLLVEEVSQTFIDYSGKLYHYLIEETQELIWASERDGWNHLYLFDLDKGTLKTQITKGDWLVRSIERIDNEERRIWFRGFGMINDQDPYYPHLARINFDGSDLKILTEGDGKHSWKWSPDNRFLLDTWSRIDFPPTTVLRDGETGESILTIEENRLSELVEAGWVSPERFAAPGRDGKTMIHGMIVKPPAFDPNNKYPILEYIYAGPQGSWGPKSFPLVPFFRECTAQGFICVMLDGMGTNWRHKAFHDVCYKNLRDAGFPDRIGWIKAAASTRPWMDLSRVGIKGTSAGGQNAAGAVIWHGDFYKVAAADSGCHDNRMDKLWWNEQWMGWPVDPSYEASSNTVNAHKLQGKLMLIVGDRDDNLDPSTTLQFVNALNKADKDYEFLFMPGGRHACGHTPYALRRQADFFRRHLLTE